MLDWLVLESQRWRGPRRTSLSLPVSLVVDDDDDDDDNERMNFNVA